MALTKAEILAAVDVVIESVECPEWGGPVCVRSLTAQERTAYELEVFDARQAGADQSDVRAKLVVLAACDADGNRLFSSDDVEALNGKSAAPVDRLFEAARRINALSDRDLEELSGN